jgi:hypothetical protein
MLTCSFCRCTEAALELAGREKWCATSLSVAQCGEAFYGLGVQDVAKFDSDWCSTFCDNEAAPWRSSNHIMVTRLFLSSNDSNTSSLEPLSWQCFLGCQNIRGKILRRDTHEKVNQKAISKWCSPVMGSSKEAENLTNEPRKSSRVLAMS